MKLSAITIQEQKEKKDLFSRRAYLNPKDEDLFCYLISSKSHHLERKFFLCRCGHYLINHKNEKKECLMENCSFCCFFFIEGKFEFKSEEKSINIFSLEFFNFLFIWKSILFLYFQLKIGNWWREWENHINVFGFFKTNKIKGDFENGII